MQAADILPVTSIHEFFGISVMEAIYCGCYPILPRRLTYPELFDDQKNPELFYDTFDELVSNYVMRLHILIKYALKLYFYCFSI